MYQVLARKYRPQTFAELVSQEHVRTTLENAIRRNRIAHGYIFSGQRGTGKTSVARILARCLNCVQGPTASPCGQCASCIEIASGSSVDVIEIDAASNRGINEMRELRESVRYRPARDRYKVFIVDEAHQITHEAFNALLKTLEEPPEWVVFILCTTEAHKIPATIASRCQQFSFRSLEFDDIVGRLEWVCRKESIDADAEVLGVLAQAGDGSLRDALSALDQAIACCGTKLDAAEVRALLGMFSLESLRQVTEALLAFDASKMLEVVHQLERDGHNLQHFCRELTRYFRNLTVAKIAGPETRLIAASPEERRRLAEIAESFSREDLTRFLQITLELYGELQRTLEPRLHMELGLLRLLYAGRLQPIEEALSALAGAPQPAPPGKASAPRPTGTPTAESASTAAVPASSGWPARLASALRELGLAYTADAVEHSTVTENPGRLSFVTPREYRLSMREAEIRKALAKLGRPELQVHIQFSANAETSGTDAPAETPSADEELTRRALEDPEVKRFRETFGGQVRAVRNLKQ
ncbi:MAG: DNA polymerase III subunit gamma/tau [Bryobacterales bacterium]|nr:DNA polymerase III subunit gamma/tau [Bryobacteraceae bacterium]MDW8353947.1 DNA polymerase III subunit gamma/tau [Bryobacterales bacterium]